MKPRRPARVKASRFDVVSILCLRKPFGKILNPAKVGHNDQEFLIFDGFHQISVLTPVVGLPFAGIVIDTQVMLLNAWVTSLEMHSRQILTDFDPKIRIFDGFHEI